ncbi:MAG: hypothetical protein LBE52_08595, partial [Providencia sp.]|nr:hypothetical protein [Providencia sp.]
KVLKNHFRTRLLKQNNKKEVISGFLFTWLILNYFLSTSFVFHHNFHVNQYSKGIAPTAILDIKKRRP